MAPDPRLTLDLLMKALRGLVLEDSRAAVADPEQFIEDLARRALSGIGLSIKYLLAKNGEAIVSGLGTFSLHDGRILYHPDDDLLQYVLLSEPDSERRSKLTALELTRNLETAASLIGLIREHLNTLQVPGQPTTSDEEMMLSVFGEVPAKKLKSSVEHLLADIMAQFKTAGVPLNPGGAQLAGAAIPINTSGSESFAAAPEPSRSAGNNAAAEDVVSVDENVHFEAGSPEESLRPEDGPTALKPDNENMVTELTSGGSPAAPPNVSADASSGLDVKNMGADEILRILREDIPEDAAPPAPAQPLSARSESAAMQDMPATEASSAPPAEFKGISEYPDFAYQDPVVSPVPSPAAARVAPTLPSEFSGISEFPDFGVDQDNTPADTAPARQAYPETRSSPVEAPAPSGNILAFPDKETSRQPSAREEKPVVREAQSTPSPDPRAPQKGVVMTVKDLDTLIEQSLSVFDSVFDSGPLAPAASLEVPVADLPLSLRAHEALKQAGIETLSSILRFSEADLATAVGGEAKAEIKALLQVRGLSLGSS